MAGAATELQQSCNQAVLRRVEITSIFIFKVESISKKRKKPNLFVQNLLVAVLGPAVGLQLSCNQEALWRIEITNILSYY